MKLLVVLALPLLVVWGSAATDVKDSLTLRVFNKDLSTSDAEMHKLLKKANLEGHGYLKEVTTTLTRRPGSSVPDYVKTLFYYKVVPCEGVIEVEKELNILLGDILNLSVVQKLKKDVKERKIKTGKLCKAGIEIHFRNEQSCGKKNNGKRAKRHTICFLCWGCGKVVMLD